MALKTSTVLAALLVAGCAHSIDDLESDQIFNDYEDTELTNYEDEIDISLQHIFDELRAIFEESGFDHDIFNAVDNNEELTDMVKFIEIFVQCVKPNLNDERLSEQKDFINDQIQILEGYRHAFENFYSKNFENMITEFANSSTEIDVAYKEELFPDGIVEEFQNILLDGYATQIYEFANKSLDFIDRLPETEKHKFEDYKAQFTIIKNGLYNLSHANTNTYGIQEMVAEETHQENANISIEEISRQHIIEAFSNIKDNCKPSYKFQNRLLNAINPVLIDNTKRLIRKLEKMEARLENEFAWKNDNRGDEYEYHINQVQELHKKFTDLSLEESTEQLQFVDAIVEIRLAIHNCETVDAVLKAAYEALKFHRKERIQNLKITPAELIKAFYEKAKYVFGQETNKLLTSNNIRTTVKKYFDSISEGGKIYGNKINEKFIAILCKQIGLIEPTNDKYNLMVDYLYDAIDKVNIPVKKEVNQEQPKVNHKTEDLSNSIVKLFSQPNNTKQKMEDSKASNSQKPTAVNKIVTVEAPQKMRKRDRFKAGLKKVGRAIAKPFVKLKEKIKRAKN